MRRKSADKQEIERDVIGYLPERFSAGYFELVRLGLKVDPHAQVFDNESSTQKKKYHQHAGGLKDEGALRFKAWVDRQIRAIGRDIQAYLNARGGSGPSPIGLTHEERLKIAKQLENEIELKCPGCDRYASWQWSFCAWCGKGLNTNGETRRTATGRYRRSDRSTQQSQAATDHEQLISGRAGIDTPREDGAETGRDSQGTIPKGRDQS